MHEPARQAVGAVHGGSGVQVSVWSGVWGLCGCKCHGCKDGSWGIGGLGECGVGYRDYMGLIEVHGRPGVQASFALLCGGFMGDRGLSEGAGRLSWLHTKALASDEHLPHSYHSPPNHLAASALMT